MSILHDRVPDHTRPAIKDMAETVRQLAGKVNSIDIDSLAKFGVGNVVIGSLANRGDANTVQPQVYIAWEPTYARVYVTVPTSAAGAFDWLSLAKHDF